MDRAGDGAAGVLQLGLTAVAGWGLRASLIANLFIIAAWTAAALRLKREYVDQLRSSLRAPRRTREDVEVGAEADTRTILEKVLESGEDRERLAALEWVSSHSVRVDERLLLRLAQDERSAPVRRSALALLLSGDEGALPGELLDRLDAEGHSVLVSAIDLVMEVERGAGRAQLEALLDTAGETTRLSVVAFVLRRLGEEFEPFARKVFDTLLAPSMPARVRRDAVQALALLPRGASLQDRLAELLEDRDPGVRTAAAESVAISRREDLVPELVRLLGRPGTRVGARRSLASFGDTAVSELARTLADRTRPVALRREVPRVLVRFPGPRAVGSLVAGLADPDRTVVDRCLEALHRLRRTDAGSEGLRGRRLDRQLSERLDRHDRLAEAIGALGERSRTRRRSLDWLLEAAEQERMRILEQVFMLLGMEHAVDDIARCWTAVAGGIQTERANAVEYLDNLLPRRIKSRLLPALETPGAGGANLLPDRSAALVRLAEWNHPWIAACAIHAARDEPSPELDAVARAAGASEDGLLREEAAAYLAATAARP